MRRPECTKRHRYIDKLLKKYKIEGCKSTDTPIVLKGEPTDEEFDQENYQSLIRALIWPSLGICPDISYTVEYLVR